MLKIINSQGFDPANESDFKYLWDIWYNATWSESIKKRFLQDINNLKTQDLPETIAIPDSSSLKELEYLWKSWMIALETKTDLVKIENSDYFLGLR